MKSSSDLRSALNKGTGGKLLKKGKLIICNPDLRQSA